MPFINPGNNVPSRVVFNSGSLDFGSQRIVDVDNLSLSLEFGTNFLYVLGSIIGQDLVRHSAKVTLSGKVKSFSPEMDSIAYGSSVPGTPNELDVLDGQATLANPVLTITDRNGKEVQYQFQNALFKSSKANLKAEEYGEFDFELEALSIKVFYSS
jgi:hypothetical protein